MPLTNPKGSVASDLPTSAVTLTATQTLTNKTLTAPTITGAAVSLAANPTNALDAAPKQYVDALTGALPNQAGQSGRYLTTNGTTASWASIASGAQTANLDLTLTASSALVNALLPVSWNANTVTLPAANTIPAGTGYVISYGRNSLASPTTPIRVVNSSGAEVGYVNSGSVARFYAIDVGSATGTWANDSVFTPVMSANATYAVANTNIGTDANYMTRTDGVVVYPVREQSVSNSTLYTVSPTTTGLAITSTGVNTTAGRYSLAAANFDGDFGILIETDFSSASGARVVTLSNGSLGTSLNTSSSVDYTYAEGAGISSTKAIFVARDAGSSTVVRYSLFTRSGTTLTQQSNSFTPGGTVSNPYVAVISATRAVVSYLAGATAFVQLIDVSTATPSLVGSAFSLSGTFSASPRVIPTGNANELMLANSSTYRLLNTASDTITWAGSAYSSTSFGASGWNSVQRIYSRSGRAIFLDSSNGVCSFSFPGSGVIRAEQRVQLTQSGWVANTQNLAVSTNSVFWLGQQVTTTYPIGIRSIF
jgi:hypothetical protein